MEKRKNKKAAYLITMAVLAGLLGLMTILYAITASELHRNKISLENMYEKNFYDLVDNINNTEMKLSKLINATDNGYRAKLLQEISKNSYLAQENINNLPYSINGLDEGVAFINQVSGYTETVYKQINNGGNFGEREEKTLEEIYDLVLTLKNALNKVSQDLWEGYSILDASLTLDGDYNDFTIKLNEIKPSDVDYPTMIYDGPFSDSEVNKEIRGLEGRDVSEGEARNNLLKIFSDFTENMLEYNGETESNFTVYNYIINNLETNNQIGYIQMTKRGGKLLTYCSYNDKNAENLTIENVKEIARDFARKNGINNVEVVWSDIVGGNGFVNLAPIENNAILYPDLIKVKIDLSDGRVLGYEATSYYTNHVQRQILTPSVSKEAARSKIKSKFSINATKLALIPLDYNQEVLCWEFECRYSGDTYYIYIDAKTGSEVNILKVISTENGNLLM